MPAPAARGRFLARATAGLLLAKSTWFSATAVLAQLMDRWDLTAQQAAGLTMAVQLGFVAGALGSGLLALPDRWRPQRLIAGSCLAAAGANGLLLVVPGPATALAVRFATGACIAGVYPPALKLAASWYRDRRGTALGVLVGALTVSSALPHLVNALGGLDWRLVVASTSLLTVAGAALLGGAEPGPHAFPATGVRLSEARAALAGRGVRLAIGGYLGHMWELYAMWAWFGVFFAEALRSHGYAEQPAAAYVAFAVIAVGGAGNVAGGLAGDHLGRARTAAWILALSSLCAVSAGPVRHAPPAALAVLGLVWGILVVADSPLFSALVTEVADQAYVGTALTIQMAAGFALTSVSIGILPALEALVGWDWALAALALGPLAGIAAMRRLHEFIQAVRRPTSSRSG